MQTGILATLLATLLTLPVQAQELRGTVRGTVTDASGAVVVGARVLLRNINTAVETNQTSNTAGQYVFDFVSPGTYTVTINMDGFRGFLQENILVQTRADITVNAKLEVGGVTETVRVTEAPVAVQFNKTTMETTLDTKMSNSLPLINRHPILLLQIDPQVVFTSTSAEQSPYHHWAGSRLDVGGGTELKNDILIDGSPNTWGPKTNYVPAMDAVSELNVQQNATDAEFGHSAGGIISLQMKGGTNDWHGTAYFFGRNPKLNALANRITRSPNVVRHNVWGVTSSTPIKKNKVFNFIAYEGQNLREPVDQIVTLPTALERTGDFSRSLNVNGAQRTIYDPLTTQFNQASNTSTRTPFAGNVIPGSRIDPAFARFLGDVWQPNGPGDDVTNIRNYKNTFPRIYEYYNWSDRVDWNVNDAWKVFGRFSRMHTNVASPNPTGSPAGSTGGSERNSLTAAGDAVWTVNPRIVFNIRGSYNKPVDRFIDPVAEVKDYERFWPGNPWFQSYGSRIPQQYYPGVTIGGTTVGRGSYWYSAPDFWNIQSKVSMQVGGRHYVKMGGEFRRFRGNSGFFQPIQFRFGPQHTADTFINPDTRQRGHEWATALLGVLDADSRARVDVLYAARNNFYGFYIQDDFKINQKWTLNIGLRYEYDTPIVDTQDRLSRYLDLTNPIPEFQGANAPQLPAEVMAIRRGAPQYNGAWVFTDSGNRQAYNAPKNQFLPRIGVAYKLNDKTAIRLGYSRYTIPQSVNNNGGINLNDTIPYNGYDNESFPLGVLEGLPRAFFRDPFPANNPLNPPTEKALGRYTNLGSTAGTTWFHQSAGAAMNDRFSVSYQTQTVSQIVLDLTYFISIGSNHYTTRNINQADPQFAFDQKAAVNQRVNNPFFNALTRDKFPGALRNQQQIAVNELLRPFPHYGNLTEWFWPGVARRYQSFQVKAQRPFTNGFNFLLGYNYHRSGADEYYDNLDMFKDNFTFQDQPDPRHKFNIAGIYDLPFGKGRKYLNGMNKVADGILGGWELSGIYTYISGRMLRFGGLQVNGDPRVDTPTKAQWFNTSAFALLPAFTRRANPLQYSDVKGPFISSVDMTVMKQFKLSERFGLEMRMEAYNLANNFVAADPSTDRNSQLFGRIANQRATFFGRQIQYTARLRW